MCNVGFIIFFISNMKISIRNKSNYINEQYIDKIEQRIFQLTEQFELGEMSENEYISRKIKLLDKL